MGKISLYCLRYDWVDTCEYLFCFNCPNLGPITSDKTPNCLGKEPSLERMHSSLFAIIGHLYLAVAIIQIRAEKCKSLICWKRLKGRKRRKKAEKVLNPESEGCA